MTHDEASTMHAPEGSRGLGSMSNLAQRPLHGTAFHWLVAAMFTVTLGYGVLLPVLPFLLERLLHDPNEAAISYHTGWLMGTFMFALLYARRCGLVSRSYRPARVIVSGSAGTYCRLPVRPVQSVACLFRASALRHVFIRGAAGGASLCQRDSSEKPSVAVWLGPARQVCPALSWARSQRWNLRAGSST